MHHDDHGTGDRNTGLGALAIVQALALIHTGMATPVPQNEALATYAPKITREMTRLDFLQPATIVNRHIRAFDPLPGSFAMLNGVPLKCLGGRLYGDGTDGALDRPAAASDPGTIRLVDAEGLVVRCRVGAVRIGVVQPSGKQRMSAADWARGRGILPGDMFDRVG